MAGKTNQRKKNKKRTQKCKTEEINWAGENKNWREPKKSKACKINRKEENKDWKEPRKRNQNPKFNKNKTWAGVCFGKACKINPREENEKQTQKGKEDNVKKRGGKIEKKTQQRKKTYVCNILPYKILRRQIYKKKAEKRKQQKCRKRRKRMCENATLTRRRSIRRRREDSRPLVLKEDGQEYAQVTKMLGNGYLEAACFDGIKRLCHIRGKLATLLTKSLIKPHKGRQFHVRKDYLRGDHIYEQVWIDQGDIILVGLRDYDYAKADVILKYTQCEARILEILIRFPEPEPAESTLQYVNDDYTSVLQLCDHIRGKVRHVQMIHWMNGCDTNGGVQHHHRKTIRFLRKVASAKCRMCVERVLACGHKVSLQCHVNPMAYKCKEKISVTVPDCGHDNQKWCCSLGNESVSVVWCDKLCGYKLPCGHLCNMKCHIANDPDHINYKCKERCENFKTHCEQDH